MTIETQRIPERSGTAFRLSKDQTLTVIDREPDAVLRALASPPQKRTGRQAKPPVARRA